MENFLIIPARIPLVDENGKITQAWYRFFFDLFSIIGTNNTFSLVEVESLIASSPIPNYSSINNQISQLFSLIESQKSLNPEINSINNRINSIESYVATKNDPYSKIQNLERRIQNLESLLSTAKNEAVSLSKTNNSIAELQAYTFLNH